MSGTAKMRRLGFGRSALACILAFAAGAPPSADRAFRLAPQLAEIGAHADVVAAAAPGGGAARGSAPGQAAAEAMLRRNLLPPAPSAQQLYLSEPSKFTFSEERQDLLLEPLLEGVHKGFFVESGAFDGEAGSNTLYFERRRGWTGLLVEPSPLNLPKLKSKGRHSYIFAGCLSDKLEQAWLGDIQVSKGEHSRITTGHDANANPVPVTCAPLPALLKLVNRNVVDFWSLNVEGSEVSVLKGMDFGRVEVGVILVAAHKAHNKDAAAEIAKFMQAHSFREAGRRDSGKYVSIAYVNPKYFVRRYLPVPAAWGQPLAPNLKTQPAPVAMMRQTVDKQMALPVNSTTSENGSASPQGLPRWASMPLILMIAIVGVSCCVKGGTKA